MPKLKPISWKWKKFENFYFMQVVITKEKEAIIGFTDEVI